MAMSSTKINGKTVTVYDGIYYIEHLHNKYPHKPITYGDLKKMDLQDGDEIFSSYDHDEGYSFSVQRKIYLTEEQIAKIKSDREDTEEKNWKRKLEQYNNLQEEIFKNQPRKDVIKIILQLKENFKDLDIKGYQYSLLGETGFVIQVKTSDNGSLESFYETESTLTQLFLRKHPSISLITTEDIKDLVGFNISDFKLLWTI